MESSSSLNALMGLVGSPLDAKGSESVEAWFLGSKAENQDLFEELILEVIRDHAFWRRNYHPSDVAQIPEGKRRTARYLDSVDHTKNSLRELLSWLKKSTPFFSLRYQGHMNWEVALPATLGYVAAMLYNPNNVTFEASPITTYLEVLVGDDLCKMLGYSQSAAAELGLDPNIPKPWGHITSGGSIANLEAMWAARNLKFFPLLVRDVVCSTPVLAEARSFPLALAEGSSVSLEQATPWQLLNLAVGQSLDLLEQIAKASAVDPAVLVAQVDASPHSLQVLGMAGFYRKFLGDAVAEPVIFVSGTKHYSLEKSAAILGLGTAQMRTVSMDLDGRMDLADLTRQLDACLEERRPVMAVVAVMGSTEESAVDPLADLLALRQAYALKGLDFVIHADAAWGGYYRSLLNASMDADGSGLSEREEPLAELGLDLSSYVSRQLQALTSADTITIDPHKSGYIPYPAGALCYRDERMRNLLTFVAPYVHHKGDEPNISGFGVEGSKPGAAVAAIYLSHKVIRPDRFGYGRILGRALLGCKRMYARLLSMAGPKDLFVCVPVPRLYGGIPGDDQAEKLAYVRDQLNGRSLDAIAADPQALSVMKEIGPDQNILAYAFNFKQIDGSLNQNLAKMNRLNESIYELLSLKPGQDIYGYDLIVSTTEFDVAAYGHAFIDGLKQRLGIPLSEQGGVRVLRSTIMNPWVADESQESFVDLFESQLRRALSKVMLNNSVFDVFEALDHSGDGLVDLVELGARLQSIGYSEADAAMVAQVCDVDADGAISFQEFQSIALPYLLKNGSLG